MKDQMIIALKEGWMQNETYVVEVSCTDGNPIHLAYLYTGFIRNNELIGYESIFSPTSDEMPKSAKDYKYVKAIRKIDSRIQNNGKQIKDLKQKENNV